MLLPGSSLENWWRLCQLHSSDPSLLSSCSMEASQHSSGLGYLTGPHCSKNFLVVLERGVYFSDMKGCLVLCSGCGYGRFGCSDGNATENFCQLLPACAWVQHPLITSTSLGVGGPRDGHLNVLHQPNGQCTFQLEWLRNWVGSQSPEYFKWCFPGARLSWVLTLQQSAFGSLGRWCVYPKLLLKMRGTALILNILNFISVFPPFLIAWIAGERWCFFWW